ncbi:MAG TPA: hypothetical protein VHW69_06690, partial [Rhizomicrobium sp.]|nr:hypothetical protein [Rhizomicrobium sp.]
DSRPLRLTVTAPSAADKTLTFSINYLFHRHSAYWLGSGMVPYVSDIPARLRRPPDKVPTWLLS